MPYKVGDKVCVKRNLEVEEEYDGVFFVDDMKQYYGKIVTINNVRTSLNGKSVYSIRGSHWSWAECMFESVVDIEIPSEELIDFLRR